MIRRMGIATLVVSVSLYSFSMIRVLLGDPVGVSAATQEKSHAPILSNPDATCAGCHREIYAKYERTPMARGSGAAVDGMLEGDFLHAPSEIRYRVFSRDGGVWMSYDRDSKPQAAHEGSALHGERELIYFIGSGHRGRTYLYQEENEWFEAPINYYSKTKAWDMAPAFGSTRTMPGALPVDSNCLHCHATSVGTALPEARNRYDGPPILQAGIGCAACHGDPSKHLAAQGHGAIVNPAKLDAARRDSTCLQCHLEGDVAIYRAGKSLAQFQAGDDLAEYVVYSVKANERAGGGRATSQYEALLRSACKVASGDKMTCTTCHDPHGSPSAEERVGYFRERCLSCHMGVKMATEHHPEQKDCAVCHMPTRATADISHEQETDHDIQRRPSRTAGRQVMDFAGADDLIPVGRVSGGDRELGLAYAQLAEDGNAKDSDKALRLLQKAEKSGANDAQVHAQLGFMEQMSGDRAKAQKEYADSLREDPYEATALGNLAVLDAMSGHTAEAVGLLQRAVDADPSQTTAALNLAFVECRIGEKKKALAILDELSRFDPDDPTLRKFLTLGIYAGEKCSLR